MQKFILSISLLFATTAVAQTKKPLGHNVYDGWKSIGERAISNDGNYIVYAVNPQEGDGELVIQNAQTKYKKVIARGYGAIITNDSRYVVFKIKAPFQDSRQARIKKKKPDEMPKDSLGIVELGMDSVIKIARVKTFKMPEKGSGWMAYHIDKPLPDADKKTKAAVYDSVKAKTEMLLKLADSVIKKSIDSVQGKIKKEQVLAAAQKAAKEIIKKAADDIELNDAVLKDADGDEAGGSSSGDGTDLVLRNTATGNTILFKLVSDYLFDKKSNYLLIETTKNGKDSNSKALVLLHHLATAKTDTVLKGFNDSKNYVFDEDGKQLAFVAERDSSTKALQKFYKLWYYTKTQDTATVATDRNTVGMKLGTTVSDNATLRFSKDGQKLFFGTAVIKPPKDTTLVDFELAKLDVWHYNDDYLQPQQLKLLDQELKRSYMAVWQPGTNKMVQLGDEVAEDVTLVNEGNSSWVLAETNKGNRIEAQWTGQTKKIGYIINIADGSKKLIPATTLNRFLPSPGGNYVYWYDDAKQNYFTYEIANGKIRNVTSRITVPLYDTENDVPDYPSAIGITGWTNSDTYFLVNDEYDIWQVSPDDVTMPKNITGGYGRKNKVSMSYIRLDPEKRFFENNDTILLRTFNKNTKYAGFATKKINEAAVPDIITEGPHSFTGIAKAKFATQYAVQRADINRSELYSTSSLKDYTQLTDIASQQNAYNWLSVELVKWKMFDGKMSEGLLYKPENFDPKKKYPVIFYFYERDADGLYNYRAPAPSASTVNVPYFVSNEYLIFDPNIYYKNGEPGASAYNSVVSAAKYLAKMPWVDSTRMAIQGQSWGGYQVAHLITRTNMFRAAGAGAPVSNMTSAYGGIRWGSGLNRQFQYERSQSRIGATLWQRPDLYIKNSPLFAADKVNTPLLIMHNDADGAVPWYQGIEYFTALRRLNKKVWMLQYNAEDHNLVERRNRKDLSIRLAQFFDYWLKDSRPAKWIIDGVPATQKGIDWGTKVE
jgi:dipeptidyl aminopeptidase/acylaminoacyl peptidase